MTPGESQGAAREGAASDASIVVNGVTLPPAFYEQLGDDEYLTTPATASPWDERLQHGGPPTALLAHVAERARPDASMQLARIAVDMLGGIPQGRLRTHAEVVRPGKRVELIEAQLWAGDKLAVKASIWRIRVDEGLTRDLGEPGSAGDLPDPQPQHYFEGVSPTWGYGRAIEWRFLDGDFNDPGTADVWTRVRIPLVAGGQMTRTEQLLVVADSVNGMSARLPISQWLSIPPTVTVTVQRPPTGDWMRFRANTQIGPHGVGIARGSVEDVDGFVAEVAQPLLVQPRT